MFTTNQSECLERAEMHEKLASSTADEPARKMHQAMAAEYRRRAADSSPIHTDNITAGLVASPPAAMAL